MCFQTSRNISIIATCNTSSSISFIFIFNTSSVGIVLCSKGYPENYSKNIAIQNFNKLKSDKSNFIFHAGTKVAKNEILATGGRVLNFVSISDNFKNSRDQVIEKIEKLNWENGFYRKDIGYKIIN